MDLVLINNSAKDLIIVILGCLIGYGLMRILHYFELSNINRDMRKNIAKMPASAVCTCPVCGKHCFHIFRKESIISAELICTGCNNKWIMGKIPDEVFENIYKIQANSGKKKDKKNEKT
jgi:hypothetical protein